MPVLHHIPVPHLPHLNQSQQRPLLLLALIGALALTATLFSFDAAESAPTPGLEQLKVKRQQVKTELLALNEDLRCTANADCATFELGAKPCGGPWEHLIYSKKNPKASAVLAKAADYNALDKQIGELEQLMSTCDFVLPPEVECRQGKCAAVEPADAKKARR